VDALPNGFFERWVARMIFVHLCPEPSLIKHSLVLFRILCSLDIASQQLGFALLLYDINKYVGVLELIKSFGNACSV
jgi:hypothetical protein